MIRIIGQRVKEITSCYQVIFRTMPDDSDSQLGLMLKVLASYKFNNVENGMISEYSSDWLEIIHGDRESGDDYDIAFYDPIFDSYVEELSEKKYGEKNTIVFDDETPMLRLSKKNLAALLLFWEKLKNRQSEYYILTQDDKGWVEVEAKEDLSDQEKQMVREFEIESQKWKEDERARVLARQKQGEKS